ncbi:MAG: hypothetical protein N2449_09580 [Bacteroidales bacterium]|nr:hypothetical protein [Bacteroidales bacterium]
MKKLVLLYFILALSSCVMACEPSITIVGKEKTKYKTNDELVVKVQIVLTHRNCTVDIKNTKFEQEGIKILSGTDWKEVEPGVWERKLKIKVTAEKGQTARLSVIRGCNKGGCNQSFVIPT